MNKASLSAERLSGHSLVVVWLMRYERNSSLAKFAAKVARTLLLWTGMRPKFGSGTFGILCENFDWRVTKWVIFLRVELAFAPPDTMSYGVLHLGATAYPSSNIDG